MLDIGVPMGSVFSCVFRGGLLQQGVAVEIAIRFQLPVANWIHFGPSTMAAEFLGNGWAKHWCVWTKTTTEPNNQPTNFQASEEIVSLFYFALRMQLIYFGSWWVILPYGVPLPGGLLLQLDGRCLWPFDILRAQDHHSENWDDNKWCTTSSLLWMTIIVKKWDDHSSCPRPPYFIIITITLLLSLLLSHWIDSELSWVITVLVLVNNESQFITRVTTD